MAIPGLINEGPSADGPPAVPTRPADTLVPDLVGLAVPEAQALVRALGLRLSFAVWETKVGPWGMVLEQRPTAGALVRQGRRLHVTISARPLVRIPEVQGLPEGSAAELLRRLGFVVLPSEVVTPASDGPADAVVPAGCAISSTPRAGALAAYGTTVTLTVAEALRTPTR